MANTAPIFSKRGAITRCVLLKTAANDYTGVSPYNKPVFEADATNGSFIQRLRFKPVGTNVATVCRIYLGDGDHNENYGSAIGAPTGTPSASGGAILTGTYYALIIAVDSKGSMTPIGTISSGVAVTGPTGSIAWSWTAVPGTTEYRIYVGATNSADAMMHYFMSATNSFSQTGIHSTGLHDDPSITSLKLYGEVSLPATAQSSTTALVDIDYPLNIALPPGWEVYVGLGTSVAAGWTVVPIAGDY